MAPHPVYNFFQFVNWMSPVYIFLIFVFVLTRCFFLCARVMHMLSLI